MIKILFALTIALVLIVFAAGDIACAQDYLPGDAAASNQPGNGLLTPDEMDNLLAPIALYPDPLIAQILPASTFIDQIDEAARYVKQYGRSAHVDDQLWDVSVKAVAHYPDVLFMMDQKYDWTVSLGQAYIDQPQDVMDAIQRLRAEAQAQGNLVSTPEQQVIADAGAIRIVPALPEYIYVPVYNPQVVYVESPDPFLGLVTFGAGLAIGAWLSRDCDWHAHRVYYHGWQAGGWVGRSRPFIQDRRGIYINRNAGTISVNRRILQHNTEQFREAIRHDVQRRHEVAGRTAPSPRAAQPTPEKAGQPRPVAPAQVRQDMNNVFRGRDVQMTQPASRTGYGGYGSGRDATMYQERGKTSRENMQQTNRPTAVPAPRPSVAPVQRQSVQPAQHQSAYGRTPSAPTPSGQTSRPAGSSRPGATGGQRRQ